MAVVALTHEEPTRTAIAAKDTWQGFTVPIDARYIRVRAEGAVVYFSPSAADGAALDTVNDDYESDSADTTFVRKVPGIDRNARARRSQSTPTTVSFALAVAADGTVVQCTPLFAGG